MAIGHQDEAVQPKATGSGTAPSKHPASFNRVAAAAGAPHILNGGSEQAKQI